MTIPFKAVVPEAGTILGFDVQINDASGGSLQSVAIWNDMSGNSFQDTSGYGELTLGDKE
jgi:endo-1,4-beta-xylanase